MTGLYRAPPIAVSDRGDAMFWRAHQAEAAAMVTEAAAAMAAVEVTASVPLGEVLLPISEKSDVAMAEVSEPMAGQRVGTAGAAIAGKS